jgi:hypothetical protein
MNQKARGSLYQDNNFVFTEFNDLKLEKIVVCENPETKEPLIVYIKVQNKNWHQYFLDAGIGFWQNWDEIDTDDEYNYIDKTDEFELLNKIIDKIWCEPHENNSQITIGFKSNDKLVLRTVKPEIFDSESELIKLENDITFSTK